MLYKFGMASYIYCTIREPHAGHSIQICISQNAKCDNKSVFQIQVTRQSSKCQAGLAQYYIMIT